MKGANLGEVEGVVDHDYILFDEGEWYKYLLFMLS